MDQNSKEELETLAVRLYREVKVSDNQLRISS